MAQRLDSAKNLLFLETLLAMDVRQAMQSAVVTGAANVLFHSQRETFFTNPANTLLHAALSALEERAVIHIAELLKSGIVDVPEGIRHTSDLLDHRDAISHPITIKWRRPQMQEFHDAHRKWLDLRPALIWDVQRSLNEQLEAIGQKPRTTSVEVTAGMVIALSGILRLSVDQRRMAIPSEEQLSASLTTFRDRYLDFLIERPDGKRR